MESSDGEDEVDIHDASYEGELEVALQLLDSRVSANLVNEEGFTPLFIATQQGHSGF